MEKRNSKYKLFYPKMERSVITANRNIQEEKAPLGALEPGLEMEEGWAGRADQHRICELWAWP